jgi:hypothetical protein
MKRAMSAVGTKRTSQAGQMMSVNRGRPEVDTTSRDADVGLGIKRTSQQGAGVSLAAQAFPALTPLVLSPK